MPPSSIGQLSTARESHKQPWTPGPSFFLTCQVIYFTIFPFRDTVVFYYFFVGVVMIDFKAVEDAIKSIGESCKETARQANDVLNKAVGVSCRSDAEAKNDLFEEIEDAIFMARKSCPEKEKEIQKIEDFYNQNATIKCGGG
jgi:hypothetical protein